jgi:class 3 adenylate cyclase
VVILAHLGSAHTDAELGILLDAAQQVVLDGQAALDFEVGARAQSMAQVADFRERALLAAPVQPSNPAPVVPPGRTLGTSSRLLYDVLAHVYDWLGFAEVGDDVLRDLVIARIVEPTSKIDALRGREVNTSGDGFLAMFDGPQRAIRCAMAIRDAVRVLGIEVRQR